MLRPSLGLKIEQSSHSENSKENTNKDMDLTDMTLTSLMKRNSQRTSSTSSSSPTNDDVIADKSKKDGIEEENSWQKEKEVFELQLTQLQEQLVAAMVQNQQLVDVNKKLEKQDVDELAKQLEDERQQRKTTEDRLKRLLSRKRRGSTNSNLSLEHEYDDLSTELGESLSQSYERSHSTHSTATQDNRKPWKQAVLEYKISTWNFIHERISDFINDEDQTTEEQEEEQLSVRRLKENVARFSEAIQPIKNGYKFFEDLFSWQNPWFTISVFIIFIYSLWLEVHIPLVLMLLIIQLTMNYLHARGIAQRFTKGRRVSIIPNEETKEQEGASTLSERYQLVLSIAKTVQNTLGQLSDSLEKLQNLYRWRHTEASKKLLYSLVVLFILSCFVSTGALLHFIVLTSALKLFIITPIYTRFPKVQRRYDDFMRLWHELPTHAEHQRQEAMDAEDGAKSSSRESSPQPTSPRSNNQPNNTNEDGSNGNQATGSTSDSNLSWGTIIFCDRFQLPRAEAPFPDWVEGRRCTLMDKENPFTSMKHGRLYLTANFLCFERNQFHSKKNIAISLAEIIKVKKSKPITFMPGPGMSIEVEVTGISKPYVFAAMMGRDEALESIVRAGKSLNLPWANEM